MYDENDDVAGVDTVGADDAYALLGVSGDDVGAARRAQRRPSPNQALARANAATRQPQILIGLDSEAQAAGGIAAGASLNITTSPSVPVRITNFQFGATVAPFFLITGIKMALRDLLGSGSGFPAESFGPTAVHPPVECPYVGAGSPIIVSVTNIDGAAHRATGTFFAINLTPASHR